MPALSSALRVQVALPESCALRQEQGVEAIIHCCGPNMNPMRHDSLEGDYTRGCEELGKTYDALFGCYFARATGA